MARLEKTAKSTKGRSVVLLVFRSHAAPHAARNSERQPASTSRQHASNESMNATSAPVVLAAFEDPDEVSRIRHQHRPLCLRRAPRSEPAAASSPLAPAPSSAPARQPLALAPAPSPAAARQPLSLSAAPTPKTPEVVDEDAARGATTPPGSMTPQMQWLLRREESVATQDATPPSVSASPAAARRRQSPTEEQVAEVSSRVTSFETSPRRGRRAST